jgi:hypothetical protein
MKEPNPPVVRVRDWDKLYENNRSRGLGRTAWFPAPNDLGADWYAEIVSDEGGAAHLGVWHALLMVAQSHTPRRVGARRWRAPHHRIARTCDATPGTRGKSRNRASRQNRLIRD